MQSVILRGLHRAAGVSSLRNAATPSQIWRGFSITALRKKAEGLHVSHGDSGSSHAVSHGHGHDAGHGHDHHDDPQADWYEWPPHVEVYPHSRVKIPWYIGKPPQASYRAPPPESGNWFTNWSGQLLGLLLWSWVTWCWCMDPGHVTGEFRWPDRYAWTDEELGVPPLDADTA